ncbi:hypothetical protein [Sphingomonas xanthus]|uniref:Uncharacterized protein n=1 Tax=Sphingomonas xanthus TaxID=2594473 RepID=A0A516INQ8_9SPHN|nr:hypothetical protein [Sphingomonas xanthus]QDP18486.1 hypothetical protein FMM02_00040 [Sphingomonas xanthus]
MMLRAAVAVLACVAFAAPSYAQNAKLRHSIGTDISFSSDAEGTEVVRLGVNADWRFRSSDDYLGVRLERNFYRVSEGERDSDRRLYLRVAKPVGNWKANATVGTDGDTILGAATVVDESPLRKEFFVERDKVETRQGVSRPIYHTFAGAAVDVPVDETTQVTLVGGVQAFTGENVRLHARGNFIKVVKSDWGLSLQLRSRYFHNSEPREYDYYSPKWYAEVIPVIQMRRFRGGWRYVAAAGFGVQRDSDSAWRQSRYLNLRVSSPQNRQGWVGKAELTYTNLPVTSAAERYSYVRVMGGLARNF